MAVVALAIPTALATSPPRRRRGAAGDITVIEAGAVAHRARLTDLGAGAHGARPAFATGRALSSAAADCATTPLGELKVPL